MKFGLAATKDLSEFLREKSNLEEHNSKQITKLAGKVASGCVNGTFAPIWVVLRSSTERLASLHMQMVQKLCELVKDVTKYADEVHKKQKAVKEEEGGTLEAVHAMQSSTVAVQKSKDVYMARLADVERLKGAETASAKELEKAETKLRKLSDEYKALWEKHIPIKTDFERKMSLTCKVSKTNGRNAVQINESCIYGIYIYCLDIEIPRNRGEPFETDERVLIHVHRIAAKQP